MRISTVRKYALSLPEVTEEPHHHLSSFRVKGKIFLTFPKDASTMNIFVKEEVRQPMLQKDSQAFEKLWWAKKVCGLTADLNKAKASDVKSLMLAAWKNKAPESLL